MALKIPRPKRRGGVSGDPAERRAARLAKRASAPGETGGQGPRKGLGARLRRAAGTRTGKPTRGRRTGRPNPLLAGIGEILAIGREMLRIPAGIALRIAERLGLLVLAAWRFLRPLLLAALALARRGLALAAREATPARAIAAVALVAAGLLAATQFLDYRDVQAGVPAYEGVENVAPPPVVDGTPETAGSAHLYLLLAVAIAAAAIVVLSMMGRWRLARSLAFLGLGAVAVAVFVDAPQGLDEAEIAVQFSGAQARLLDVFWVEVFASAVIGACGPLLALNLRPVTERSRNVAADEGRRGPRLGRSGVQGTRS